MTLTGHYSFSNLAGQFSNVQIGLVAALAATTAPFTAFAQDGNNGAGMPSVIAPSAPRAKAIQAANHKLAKAVRTAMAKAKGST